MEPAGRDVLDGGEADGEAGRCGFGEQRTARQADGDEPALDRPNNLSLHLSLPAQVLLTPPAVPFWMPPSAAQEKSPVASRKHVEDFLFLSRVLERRIGRFSSSAGDSGCSSSDSTTLASPFCLESARRWHRALSSWQTHGTKCSGWARGVGQTVLGSRRAGCRWPRATLASSGAEPSLDTLVQSSQGSRTRTERTPSRSSPAEGYKTCMKPKLGMKHPRFLRSTHLIGGN